jgi:hypothetical protein
MSASLSLFDKEHASRERYIYFLCSVSGALVAYIGKDFKPNHPFSNHDILTLWCLGCLTGSFLFGLCRILLYIHGMGFNREVVFCDEEIANLNKSLAYHLENADKGVPASFSNKISGPVTIEDIRLRIVLLSEKRKKETVTMNSTHYFSTFFLVICQLSLLAGFVLLLLSKILS